MSRAGTILRIDLTETQITKEPTSRYVQDYIGGAGIAARIFWEEVTPDTRPFDPRNLLTFNTGPLTGTLFGNKAGVASKSPVPANSPYVYVGIGGQFPSEIKFADSSGLTLFEVNDAAKVIQKSIHPDANIIFGVTIDPNLKDAVKLTLIATGFITKDASTLARDEEVKRLLKGLKS